MGQKALTKLSPDPQHNLPVEMQTRQPQPKPYFNTHGAEKPCQTFSRLIKLPQWKALSKLSVRAVKWLRCCPCESSHPWSWFQAGRQMNKGFHWEQTRH